MIYSDLDVLGKTILAEGMKLSAGAGVLTVSHVLLAFLSNGSFESRGAVSGLKDIPAHSVEYDPSLLQAAGSATAWARTRGEQVTIEHLIVVIIDQGSPEAIHTVRLLNLEPLTLRRSVLTSLGIAAEEPPVELLEICAATNAPQLGLESLPGDIRYEFTRTRNVAHRGQARRLSDWSALVLAERARVERLAKKHHLTEYQVESLLSHQLRKLYLVHRPDELFAVKNRHATAIGRPGTSPLRSVPIRHLFRSIASWVGNSMAKLQSKCIGVWMR